MEELFIISSPSLALDDQILPCRLDQRRLDLGVSLRSEGDPKGKKGWGPEGKRARESRLLAVDEASTLR